MEQGDEDDALILDLCDRGPGYRVEPCFRAVLVGLFFLKQTPEGIQHIEAVLQEAALAGEVELRTCGCCVEVALADVVHQLVDAGPLDLGHL